MNTKNQPDNIRDFLARAFTAFAVEKCIPILISACIALEAWTLKQVVDLKIQVAQLDARVALINPPTKTIAKR